MNNKINIEKLLISADNALTQSEIVLQNIPVLKEYDGYISGFGATVINIGIKAALAFYMKDATKLTNGTPKIPYRARVVRALAIIVEKADERALFDSVCALPDDNQILIHAEMKKLVDASIALKLMIRTYEFNDKDKKD
ncbi:MAG: hypothetical protein LBV74_10975 [Tannerella sp.]|jgi:hypothetical protein|nr:hypothetical protein [Tannerella sp.]